MTPSDDERPASESAAPDPDRVLDSDPSNPSTDSAESGSAGNPNSSDRPPEVDETAWEGSREERQRARMRGRFERMGEHRRRHARKERVLHTRISEQLSDDIRRLADDLRVPTSNLVRNVLEEVFTVVENVTDDVGELFEDVLEEADATRDRIRRRRRGHARRRRHSPRQTSEKSWADVAEAEIRHDEAKIRHDEAKEHEPAPRREPPEFPDVIGWQPLVLNQAGNCADCERKLSRGTRAFVGLTENGLSRNKLCRDCIQLR